MASMLFVFGIVSIHLINNGYGWSNFMGDVQCGGTVEGTIPECSQQGYHWKLELTSLRTLTFTNCHSPNIDTKMNVYDSGGYPVSIDYCSGNDYVGQIYCADTTKETFTIPNLTEFLL